MSLQTTILYNFYVMLVTELQPWLLRDYKSKMLCSEREKSLNDLQIIATDYTFIYTIATNL